MATPRRGDTSDGLVEALIHERGGDAQRDRAQPLPSRPVSKFRTSDDEQDDRPKRKRHALVADGAEHRKHRQDDAALH